MDAEDERERGVPCPDCSAHRLVVRATCLSARLVCPGCGRRFTVEQLAPHLDDADFDWLARALGYRLSDRL